EQNLRPELEQAIELLLETKGRVVVSGLGKSGHIGAKIAATLSSTGTPAQFIHATEALHGDSGALSPGDTGILISHSGSTAEVVHFATMLMEGEIPFISLTRNDESILGRIAQVNLSTAIDT